MTLLVGCQEEHPACKNWVMSFSRAYLFAVRGRLFAYGPVDATAIPKPHHLNPDWFYLSGTGWPRLSWKRPLNGCSSSSSYSLLHLCASRDTLRSSQMLWRSQNLMYVPTGQWQGYIVCVVYQLKVSWLHMIWPHVKHLCITLINHTPCKILIQTQRSCSA